VHFCLTCFATHVSQFLMGIGYVGIWIALFIEGLGIPFPGDAFLLFYGFSASTGNMSLVGVLLCAATGYVTGTSIAFVAATSLESRFFGSLSKWRIVPANKLERVTKLVRSHGALILIPGKFLPGVRSLSPYAAGLSRMAFRRFVVYTIVGSILWCTLFTLAGYFFGESVHELLHAARRPMLAVGAIALTIGLALYVIRKLVQRREKV